MGDLILAKSQKGRERGFGGGRGIEKGWQEKRGKRKEGDEDSEGGEREREGGGSGDNGGGGGSNGEEKRGGVEAVVVCGRKCGRIFLKFFYVFVTCI